MPINIAAYLQPRNATNPNPALRGTYYLLEDIYLKGGFQVRDNIADRDSINPLNLKQGQLVLTKDTGTLWTLNADLTSWAELKLGGGASAARKTITYVSDEIKVKGFKAFALPLGNTVIIQKLEVTTPLMVEAFETVNMTDSNPYTFIPTSEHLSDDGATLLANGDTVKNRRYTILTNQDDPPSSNIYFRLTNNTEIATATTLTIQYVSLEKE